MGGKTRYPNRGNGLAIQFLRSLAGYYRNSCVLFPFHVLPNGYAQFCHTDEHGKHFVYAHRFICEQTHGPAPTPSHHASHSCHNPRCVNPRHLSWKTASENMQDKKANGTAHLNGSRGPGGKLTPDQVLAIRAAKGVKTLAVLADEHGVTIKTIRNAQNRVHHANVAETA